MITNKQWIQNIKVQQNYQRKSKLTMSIYSGFATRQQEETYDQLLQDLVFVLQKRIIKFYNAEEADEAKFLDVLVRIHQHLAKMEENKYLEPKSSKWIQDLLRLLLKNAEEKPVSSQNIGGNTAPLIKNSRVSDTKILPKEGRLHSHRDSLAKLHEPTSIGKIIKQIQEEYHENSESLTESRNTYINQNKLNKNSREDRTPSLKNPEEAEQPVALKANHTEIQYRSKAKQVPSNEIRKQHTRDYLLEYLQKNNKNYLRGYRKRQIKNRAYSKEYSAI